MKTVIKSELIAHPMEEILDIEPCTTLAEYQEIEPDQIIAPADYDSKDMEIESKIEDIYTMAMSSVNTMSDEIERVEGKYKARMGEVTATMLNVALSAVREKRELKKHKDGQSIKAAAGPQTVNNNLVVADRNEILQMLRDKKKASE